VNLRESGGIQQAFSRSESPRRKHRQSRHLGAPATDAACRRARIRPAAPARHAPTREGDTPPGLRTRRISGQRPRRHWERTSSQAAQHAVERPSATAGVRHRPPHAIFRGGAGDSRQHGFGQVTGDDAPPGKLVATPLASIPGPLANRAPCWPLASSAASSNAACNLARKPKLPHSVGQSSCSRRVSSCLKRRPSKSCVVDDVVKIVTSTGKSYGRPRPQWFAARRHISSLPGGNPGSSSAGFDQQPEPLRSGYRRYFQHSQFVDVLMREFELLTIK